MKSKLFLTVLLITIGIVLSAAVFLKPRPQEEFLEDHASLVVREIGRRLLLYAGDSVSRVLPVKRLSRGQFQLDFQNEFAFVPDTLVKIVQHSLATADLPLNYMVNVFDCSTREVIYGFEVRPGKADIVPCLGRTQPGAVRSLYCNYPIRQENHFILQNFHHTACNGHTL